MSFVHLNVKSEFNQNSLIKVENLLEECEKQNMTAVAICDNSLYHVIDFIQKAREKNINPILSSCFLLSNNEKNATPIAISLFAKNRDGFRHLTKLSSIAKTRKEHKQIIYLDEFLTYKDDLIVVIDCYELLENKKIEVFKEYMHFFTEHIPKDDVYIALDRTSENQKIDDFLLEYSIKFHKKLVAMKPVNYLKKEDQKNYDILLAIHRGSSLKASTKDYSFSTKEEMKMLYKGVEEAIFYTKEIADKCQVAYPLKGERGFQKKNPLFDVPEDFKVQPNFWKLFTPMDGYEKPNDEQEIRTIAYLCTLAWRGFAKFYKKHDKVAMERLKEELGVVIGKGYSEYFLIVHDFIQYAMKHQIALGPGRGSAASSLLARCLGITEICPIQMNLQFERFLNVFREDDPDVDIDVSQEKRYELIRYAIEKYGKNRVAQIVTFKYYGLNDALRACGKVLKIKTKTINQVIKAFSKTKTVKNETKKISQIATTYESFMKEITSNQEKKEFSESNVRLMIESALVIQYIPQTDSKHAAGIILSQHDITEEIPVMFGKGKDSEEIYITQIPNNNQQLERMGFTKIDLLGNRNVDIIDKTKKLIQKKYGIHVDKIPYDDEKVYKIFQSGDLTGVFQMDSQGMQKASKTIKPINLNDITVLLALYRPGPMDQIPVYAKNKEIGNIEIVDANGEKMENVDELKEVLKDTYGIIVFQEQVNKIANVWAGYSLAEADILRRAISKKNREILEREGEIFLQKSIQNGRDEKTTKKIYELIVKFADYGFNRAHSAVYGLLSYQTAWYKVNFPKEYMSVLMTSVMKKIDKVSSYYNETRRLGIKIEKPNINQSSIGFVPKTKSITFGLAMIKNVGVVSVREILLKRKEKPFESLQDFLSRVDSYLVNKETVECLIKAGAFDLFGDRQDLLDELNGEKKISKTRNFYSFSDIPGLEDDLIGEIKEEAQEKRMPIEKQLEYEYELTSTYLNGHFLSDYREVVTEIIQNRPLKKDCKWILGGFISKRVFKDRNKKDMAYISIIDGKKEVRMICFNQVWEKIKEYLVQHHILLFQVKKNEIGELIVEDVEKVTNRKKFTVPFDKTDEGKNQMKEFLTVLKKHPGKDDLIVTFGNVKKISYSSINVEEEMIQSVKEFEKQKRIKIMKKTQ